MKKWYSLVFLMLLFLSGCTLPLNPTTTPLPSSGIIQTWIDAPLDGEQLPLAPYEIVFHANDPLGVHGVEILINDQALQLNPALDGKPMQEIHTMWIPEKPGEYAITAYTLDINGKRDQGSLVKVVIMEEPTSTELPKPTQELPPSQPTPTTTITGTPAPLLAGLTVSPHEVVYGNCGTNQIQFTAQVNYADNITNLYLFIRLRDPNSVQQTAWNNGFAMNPTTQNGIFVYTLSSSALPEMETFQSAYLEYQFAAVNASGAVIERSPVFGDVLVKKCGIIQPIFTLPPQFTLIPPVYTPTVTPAIVK